MAETCVEAAWTSYISRLSCGELPSYAEMPALCNSGLLEVLATLFYDHFQDQLQTVHVKAFWDKLLTCKQQPGGLQARILPNALQELAASVKQQSQQLSLFAQQLLLALVQTTGQAKEQQQQQVPASTVALLAGLCHKHRAAVASIIMSSAPLSLPGVLQQYYQQKLQRLCEVIQQQQADAEAAEAAGSQDDSGGGASSSDDGAMSEDADGDAGKGGQQLQSPDGDDGSPGDTAGAGRHRSAANAAPALDPLALLGSSWCKEVSGVANSLSELGLAAASEEAYTRVVNSHVLAALRSLATSEFDSAVLPRAQQLVCAGPIVFLQVLLGQGQEAELKLQEWQLRLTYLMLETLGALRSADMFDIVIDYPDSAPALQDLGICLQHTNMAGQFAAAFKGALQQRLLHAGAATADIIHTYVSTIRAMRQVDRSGLLLDIVSEPIRSYLRSRPDTIRCIVSMLTEDTSDEAGGGGSCLLQELQAQQQNSGVAGGMAGFGSGPGAAAAAVAAGMAPPGVVAAMAAAGAGGGDGSSNRVMYNWCVSEAEGDDAALRLLEALEAGPEAAPEAEAEQSGLLGLPVRSTAAASAALLRSGLGGHVDADVVSMLIGIYGGPLLFMEEYRTMLADRLLAKDEYDCEREITTLELLKIRFGDAGLHPCEVMLKDLADSKRLDANVRALPSRLSSQHQQQQQQQAQAKQLAPGAAAALTRLRATICSYLFWPDLPEHDMKLPADLQTALEVYGERFQHLKAPRKLRWRPTMGLVELTLTIGDCEPLDFRVTPVHAALLLQFSDDSTAAAAAGGGGGGGSATAAAGGGGGGAAAAGGRGGGSAGGVTASSPGGTAPSGSSAVQQQQQGTGVQQGTPGVSLTAAQLAAALGVPVPVVRRKAMFWVAAGVLLERRGAGGEVTYLRASSIDPSRIVSREVTDMSWKEDAGASSSAEDRIIAEMGPFENYIIGLLTNCGTLPLDRMHNMLRVFVVGEPRYEGRTQEQLAAFLQIMVAREKIDVNNGIYSKRKAAA